MSEQTLVPVLHHLASSQSHRVLFALEELAEANGTQFKLEKYGRSRHGPDPSLKPIFPLGKSPAMTVEENGALSKTVFQHPKHPGVLTESRLILQFLADNFSKGMWEPQDATDRCQDTFMQEFANSTVAAKAVFALIFEAIPAQLPFGFRQLVALMVSPIVKHWMGDLRPIFQVLEDTLSDERPWFAGRRMGLADINMSWGMDLAWQRGYFEKQNYPKVKKWYETITQRPAYKRALEKGGDYDFSNLAA